MSKLLTSVLLSLAAGSLALEAAGPASATVLLSEPGVSAFRPTPGSYTFFFDAPVEGEGTIDFGLVGRGTIDGQGATCGANECDDTFTLILNGNDLFQGLFHMGGLGVDLVLFSPGGATVSATSGALGEGGTATLSLPAVFRNGMNSLTFVYTGLDQGMDDEAWAIADLTVRDNVAGVPEPSSWALMIAGFGLAGAALRRRSARPVGRPA
ncbi:PEPxxWA-CTERM sorting domain-containing protein [Phenylobacterium sp.]|uniref:PEPxxWA-CTERM sorting domain-containing protein n=1 Tax=Phenylobacterium sp. TaxID=1871053 RepID=UPI0025EA0DC1|nr:PEPxxWA-CTERM sorting domain-containing protein [Phenylobacterium sp.]